jgi:hypothetical protein
VGSRTERDASGGKRQGGLMAGTGSWWEDSYQARAERVFRRSMASRHLCEGVPAIGGRARPPRFSRSAFLAPSRPRAVGPVRASMCGARNTACSTRNAVIGSPEESLTLTTEVRALRGDLVALEPVAHAGERVDKATVRQV